MFVPNSKLDMPELLYPGRKPVGKVKIDWSHPLAKGIKILSSPNHNFATGTVQKYTVGHSANGEHLTFGENTDSSFFTPTDNTQRLQTFTSSVIIDINSTTAGYVWNSDVRAVITIGREGTPSDVISAVWYDGSFRVISALTTLTGYVRIDFVRKQGAFTKLYINGELVAENIIDLENIVYSSPRGASLGALQFNYAYSNRSLDINLYQFTYRNVALSSEEIADLYLDPYKFLIPA